MASSPVASIELKEIQPQEDHNCIIPSCKAGTLNSLFECPVCYEVMTGVVNLCIKGHSICGDCCQKFLRQNGLCPLCRQDLLGKSTRNYIFENLASVCVFQCKNAEQGCLMRIEGRLYKDHLKVCNYRGYSCEMLTLAGDCSKPELQLKEFIQHLHEKHQVPICTNGEFFQRRFNFEREEIETPLVIVKYEDKVFLVSMTNFNTECSVHIQTDHEYLSHRWVIMVDNEGNKGDLDPRKYTFKMTVQPYLRIFGLHLDDSHTFSDKEIEENTIIRSGHPITLSEYTKDRKHLWKKEDYMSVYGFSTPSFPNSERASGVFSTKREFSQESGQKGYFPYPYWQRKCTTLVFNEKICISKVLEKSI